MSGVLRWVKWTGALVGALLSPMALVYGAPLACGIGSDIIDTAGARPVALGIAAIVAIAGRRQFSRLPATLKGWALRRRSLYAAKSIT
jgi:hypothetical protein